MQFILRLPFLVILAAIASVAMLMPMALAVRIGDFETAWVFFQSGTLSLLMTGLIAIATSNYNPTNSARSHLISLLGAFAFLPVILALPLATLLPDVGRFQLYFEMVSSLTTTGATVFDDSSRLGQPVHIWRGFVGWLGGLLILVSAISILSPLNLGGFEIYSAGPAENRKQGMTRIKMANVSERLIGFTLRLGPAYLAATVVLALLLMVSGERSFTAVMHAMATLSTSGITAEDGQASLASGIFGEILIFLFLLLAVSRSALSLEFRGKPVRTIFHNQEFSMMLVFITVLPLMLFFRHWIGAIEVNEGENFLAAFKALWGSMFTVLSFLTTTGFESFHWSRAQDWSGLHTPGIILIGLAVMGGGVATTAGGIKLLRVYALYRHGLREMQKLTFPSSVPGRGGHDRPIHREGALLAWLFFMLFAVSTAVTMLALTLTGLSFEQSLTFAVAALSTTGPLAPAVGSASDSYAMIGDAARAVLCVAMIVGRLETLAIIALLNPEFWRP